MAFFQTVPNVQPGFSQWRIFTAMRSFMAATRWSMSFMALPLMWTSISLFWGKSQLQFWAGHGKGPVCLRIWRYTCLEVGNLLLQMEHSFLVFDGNDSACGEVVCCHLRRLAFACFVSCTRRAVPRTPCLNVVVVDYMPPSSVLGWCWGLVSDVWWQQRRCKR